MRIALIGGLLAGLAVFDLGDVSQSYDRAARRREDRKVPQLAESHHLNWILLKCLDGNILHSHFMAFGRITN